MDKKTFQHYETRASIFKALAHPTRLFIVEQLADCERCVCEITDGVGSDISTVSKHLTILRNAGIIESEKKGSHIYYRLKFKCVLSFFSCTENLIKSSRVNTDGE